ncbi:cytochrome P450 CYP72A616-like [Cryptomeria japonica]|uniref:cytochrome P450 CYP72A616-like n=1 Tax=Cryptomeria japonica TaxID=3369 RepID=UPI0027DA9CF8|nr:cytochrome P450 CYP72A616-like [Cryptomeria japonica]
MAMEMGGWRGLLIWGVVLSLAHVMVKIARAIWWRPRQHTRCFEAQGIRGPSYKLLSGNLPEMMKMIDEAKSKPMEFSHRIVPRVLPHYYASINKYGRFFVYWFGTKAKVNIPDVELLKEILSTKFGHYEKPPQNRITRQLLGGGLGSLDGEEWAKHRRIINPAFYIEQLKGMVPTVADSASDMIKRWKERIGHDSQREIEVSKEFRDLTADIISRTAFGSSYVEGKHIFDMQVEQLNLIIESIRTIYIPGFGLLPTKKNRRLWKLGREINRSSKVLIEGRQRTLSMDDSERYRNDLLGLMVAKIKKEPGSPQNACMTVEEIIEECKFFFFAGHETSSALLTWTMVLLGMHQEWQEAARKEVLEVCGKDVPHTDTINRLKIVTMILNEALRLYAPATQTSRHTYKEMKLGDFNIPAGIELSVPIIAIHHDPELWGNDADEFKPQRFAEGAAKASKHPLAFMPFGLGPRACVGQNFAMIEAKVVLAIILQQFSFSVSPSYVHAPATVATLQPQYGAQIIVHPLQN